MLYRYAGYNAIPIVEAYYDHSIFGGIGLYNDRFSDSLQDYPTTYKGILQLSNFQGDSITSLLFTHEDTNFYLATGRFPHEAIRGMCKGPDGSLYCTGEIQEVGNTVLYDYDIQWIKTDSMGNLVHRITLASPVDTVMIPWSMNYLDNNEMAITGNIRDTISYDNQDGFIAVVDTLGALKRYLTYRFGSSPTVIFNAYRTSDGGFVGMGTKDYLVALANVFAIIFKIDSLGNVVWEHTLNSNYYSFPGNLVRNSAGDFLFNYVPRFYSVVTGVYAENRLMKFTEQGTIIWDKTLNVTRENNAGGRVSLLPDDRIFTASYYFDTIQLPPDVFGFMSLLDQNGNVIWNRNISTDSLGLFGSLKGFYSGQPTPDGGFIAAGENYCCNFSVPWNSYSSSFWVVKTDSVGLITGLNNGMPAYIEKCYIGNPIPNPAVETTRLTLALPPEIKNARLEIFTTDSRLYKSIPVERSQQEVVLNVSDYPSGLYIIALNADGFAAGSCKLLVE
jgi:hypothetical protein